jgi:transcriptional regulator with XRE-family HTH domain
MNSGDLWRGVGLKLREVRERQPGPTFLAHFAELAEIDVNTAKAIERGDPRSITKLEDYAFALGLSIVDVFSTVLKAAERPPTPEAAALVRYFENLGVEDRRLLLASAERLWEQHEAVARLEAQVAAAAPTPAPTPGPQPIRPRTTPVVPAETPSTPYAGSPVERAPGEIARPPKPKTVKNVRPKGNRTKVPPSQRAKEHK